MIDGMRDFLTTEEVRQKLGIGRATVYRWIHEGRLPVHRMGSKYFFVEEEVRAAVMGGAPDAR